MKYVFYSICLVFILVFFSSCSKKEKETEQNQQVNQEISLNMEKKDDVEKYLNTYIIEFENEPNLVKSTEWILTQYHPNEIPSTSIDKLYTLYDMLFDPNSIRLTPPLEALSIFRKLEAIEVIQKSLLHHEDVVVSRACDAVMDLGSTDRTKQYSTVPYLIKALDNNNYRVSGSEIGLNHKFLKYKIIKNIKIITGLDFDITKIDADDTRQIEEVLSKTKDWAKEHNIKLLDEQ